MTTPVQPKRTYSRWFIWLVVAVSLALLALGLAWISTVCPPCDFSKSAALPDFTTWLSFIGALLLCAALMYGAWQALLASEPKDKPGRLTWLAGLLVGAALLRLAMGVVWYTTLPRLGHGTPQETAGYVMADAYQRDELAWKLAESQKPIWQSLTVVLNRQDSSRVDQYGGLLVISILVYRYLGGNTHNLLVMAAIIAAISSLAIPFTWAFARRSWDDRVAKFAAWGIALYPETVLLGSAQMREALIIPLIAAAFYGLARLRRDRSWVGLAWLLGGVLLTMLISPPFSLVLVFALALAAFAIRDDLFHGHIEVPGGILHRRWSWLALAAVIVLVVVGGWLALKQLAPSEISNPLDVASYWIRKTSDLQAYFSKSASGWIQKIFLSTPAWSHIPILVGYGALRPFLPAAMTTSSDAPIWPWITLWRAAGWTILLGLLVYAFLRAWLKKDTDHFTRALTIIVWLVILIASLRGGGDQDDNPRYRATFASIQVALAAWGWVEQSRTSDPIFRRALVTVAFIIAWSFLWYLRRIYTLPWAVVDPFKTIGLGLACGVLYSIWDWARRYKSVGNNRV
jgi:hypothetical protein